MLCLLTASLFAGGNGEVKGTVKGADDLAMEFANVLLLKPADSSLVKGTITDSLGNFAIGNLPFENYLLAVKSIGYAPAYTGVFNISETNTEHSTGIIRIEDTTVSLDEVVVKSRKPTVQMYADKLVLNVEDSPIATGNTALELLEQAPGVSLDHNDNISLKGQAGVLVIIDGKQTYLSNQEVAKMLDGMSGESVKKIEVIHNPSAKYDAEGTAGVINIVMKKDKNLGLNGRISGSIAQGLSSNYRGKVELNYREKKYNVFGSYGVGTRNEKEYLLLERRVPSGESTTIFDQRLDELNDRINYQSRVGFDYFLSDKTTVGFLFNRNATSKDSDNITNTQISGDPFLAYESITVDAVGDNSWYTNTYNANVTHAFDDKGHQLSVDADYSRYDDPSLDIYENRFYNAENEQLGVSSWIRSNSHSKVDMKALKLDYARPLSETLSLEMGAKMSRVNTDNSILFELRDGDADWTVDDGRSNQFIFDEKIYAAYGTVSTRIKNVDVQVGLRSEYTVSDGRSVTLDETFQNKYLQFFPNLSLAHSIGDSHSLNYSYSRRIGRPNYEALNPFVYFLDQYTYSQGNPYLKPEFSHNFNVTHGFKNFIYTTLSYSRTTDAITEVLEQDDATLTTFQTTENFKSTDNLALNIAAPVPVKDWWMMRFDLTGWYGGFNSELSSGSVDKGSVSGFFYWMNMFELGNGIQAQTNVFYQSPLVWGLYDLKSEYGMDFGLSKEVLDGKGELTLNVQDVFNTQRTRLGLNHGNIDLGLEQKDETQRIQIGFTYNFGKSSVKKARSRTTATEEERNRVNGGN